MSASNKTKRKQILPRFDLLAISAIVIFTIAIAFLIGISDRSSGAKIANFSWQNRQISSSEKQFYLDFDRPVDRKQIENSLQISPPLLGKTSWSGNRLFYTLTEIPLAETNYQLKLTQNKKLAEFTSKFKTRDRVFAYLGVEPEESGRIVLYNYSQKRKTILTPKDLVIAEYKVVANGTKIIFFAYDRGDAERAIDRLQLYAVTTGIDGTRLGSIEKLIDAEDYQNIDFDSSSDGNSLIVERKSRKNSNDTSLWSIVTGEKPRSLGVSGDSFRLSPEGDILALVRGTGVNLISLNRQEEKTQLLSNYAEIIGFSPEGDRLLLVKYNRDYSRSLFLLFLREKREPQEVYKSFSLVLNCQFEPRQKKNIYCIKNDLTVEEGEYRQLPFLTSINLETKQALPLLSLPNSQEVRLTISPDGALLLFDRSPATASANIWRLPLLDIEATGKTAPPQQLHTGFYPQWLP